MFLIFLFLRWEIMFSLIKTAKKQIPKHSIYRPFYVERSILIDTSCDYTLFSFDTLHYNLITIRMIKYKRSFVRCIQNINTCISL